MRMWAQDGFGSEERTTQAVRMLLVATISVFVAQVVLNRAAGHWFSYLFALSAAGLRRGAVWQPATYVFLHGSIAHLALNMVSLFFFGPDIERAFGRRRFVVFYFLCGICAGLAWVAISARHGGICIGASGAVFGVLGAFAALFPNRPVTLIFPVPMTLRARTLALILGALTFALLFESGGTIAHAAHLAGGLIGYLYARQSGQCWGWNDVSWEAGPPSRFREWLAALRGKLRSSEAPPAPGEVDRILEKISEKGLRSLTCREKRILDRASRR